MLHQWRSPFLLCGLLWLYPRRSRVRQTCLQAEALPLTRKYQGLCRDCRAGHLCADWRFWRIHSRDDSEYYPSASSREIPLESHRCHQGAASLGSDPDALDQSATHYCAWFLSSHRFELALRQGAAVLHGWYLELVVRRKCAAAESSLPRSSSR